MVRLPIPFLCKLLLVFIALAIGRGRMMQRLAQRRRDLESLVRMAGRFARPLHFAELAPQILTEMQAAFGADRLGIWLYDDDRRMAECVASIGDEADLIRGHRFAIRDYAGRMAALRHGQPIFIADPADFLVKPPGGDTTLPCSMAIFPLISEETGLGTITLSYTRAGHAFPPDRIPFGLAICAQAAIALAKARLVDRLEQTLQRLQQVQEQLIRSERMSAIGQVASYVSHEIKNRLNVIKLAAGLGEMLADRTDAKDRLQSTMRTIAREVDRGNSLMMSLLQFARPTVPKREPVELVAVIETALLFAHRSNITVHRQWSAQPARVQGDPAALEQVFLNLILNAVQAMPHGGDLTIRLDESHGCWQIRIRDTGGGIPAEVLPHLFEPFYTTKAAGTGLGLVITKQIVEAHDGRIFCHSEPGRGTVFIVRLPEAPIQTRAHAA
ncbi:MAG: GAF domain-containing protein [Candidatus Sericytochromatia bacterium]|nr:GAF domain-containing protein [Candidatus Sericytochromatia bacterium]